MPQLNCYSSRDITCLLQPRANVGMLFKKRSGRRRASAKYLPNENSGLLNIQRGKSTSKECSLPSTKHARREECSLHSSTPPFSLPPDTYTLPPCLPIHANISCIYIFSSLLFPFLPFLARLPISCRRLFYYYLDAFIASWFLLVSFVLVVCYGLIDWLTYLLGLCVGLMRMFGLTFLF